MPVRIERATLAHAEAVERELLRELNPRIDSATWRRLFAPRWADESLPLGSVLVDEGRIVGFASYIHARLPRAAGSDSALCNISTWVTAPSHTSQALSLVMPALALRDVTVTNLTPTESVNGIFSKLGFKLLEDAVYWLRPAPWMRAEWNVTAALWDPAQIAPRLPEWERRILKDHESLLRHLWIPGPSGQYAYLQYQVVQRRKLKTAKLLWSTPGALDSASIAIRRALRRACGAWLVELEARSVSRELPQATRVPLPVQRLYRSATLAPSEVPSAYSEMPLLGI
jgi:hypothetical protein